MLHHSPDPAPSPPVSEADEGDGKLETALDGDEAAKGSPRRGGKTPSAGQVAVRDPKLYTDLLDSCDWSAHVARQAAAEKTRKEKELQCVSAAHEAAQRRQWKEQSLRDARAIAEAKAKKKERHKEAQDTADFYARNDAFFARQQLLHAAMGPRHAAQQRHRSRVKQRLHAKWESEVFAPTQAAIDEEMSRREGPPQQHYVGSGNTGRTTASTTREERLKHERREALLRESVKKERGLFLDTIDTTEYDPIRQREQATVRYHLPPHCGGSGKGSDQDSRRRENDAYFTVQQKEATELAIARDYVRLAVAYRAEEQQCRTGVLGSGDGSPAPGDRAGCTGGLAVAPTTYSATAAEATEQQVEEGGSEEAESRTGLATPPPPVTAFAAIRVEEGREPCPAPPPRTHIPYPFATAHGKGSNSSGRSDLPYVKGGVTAAATNVADSRGGGGGGDATGASTTRRVMPLPPQLTGTVFGSKHQSSAASHRERALPIPMWEQNRLKDTHIARYVREDGSNVDEFCERKQWEGAVMLDSQIRLM